MLKKIFLSLFSTRASGIYILLFACSIGAATFVENDFGTSSAQRLIFKSWWFEALLIVFGISILVNIIQFQMIRQRKWTTLLFHVAILVILTGAGITRYFGYEGRMYIREGESSNAIVSGNSFLKFKVKTPEGKSYSFDEPVLFASLGKNTFDRSYLIGNQLIQIKLTGFVPNPAIVLQDDIEGQPTIKLVVTSGEGREEYYLQNGETKLIHEVKFNFSNQFDPNAINMVYQDNHLMINSPDSLSQFQMLLKKTDMLAPGMFHPLLVRTLYSAPSIKFVIGDFKPKASTFVQSSSLKIKNESTVRVNLDIDIHGKKGELFAQGIAGDLGEYQTTTVNNYEVSVSYGSKMIQIPFAIKLRDFILDRYPGTNSPASYASEVTLVDDADHYSRDQRIYMNHILNYKGFRFFQSSYDRDELGTVLSVNHDAWGTRISYLGYFLLTLGMAGTLLSKKSRFRNILDRLHDFKNSALKASTILAFLLLNHVYASAVNNPNLPQINKTIADQFSLIQVQDQNGRLKPMHTLDRELLRKLSRTESFDGLNADQIVLGMIAFPETYADIPLIKIANHAQLKKILNTSDRMVTYNRFFNPNYVLEKEVTEAYNRDPKDRTTYDKDLIKLDEKVNICNLIFSGRLMQWFPVPGDKNNTWISPNDPHTNETNSKSSLVGNEFYSPLILSLRNGVEHVDWNEALQKIKAIQTYQSQNGQSILLSPSKVKGEIFLNKLNIFSKAVGWYALLGLGLLILFFISIFNSTNRLKWPIVILKSGVYLVFLFHTIGLGVRWYVSGRAPWSNGYESMIYIAFTTMLSALLFTRRSIGGLAAACLLASTILMVAGLSFMDPEITPLVPVLKSYWLTIHVSMEAGSYGFLTLGAIIGILNLILMICTTPQNKLRIQRIVSELSLTSELILIAGLMIISIGTYLGGVWANESWGRYWGWDAKETWALVTILVYAFILHMRFIPGLRGMYAFNLSTLFGFASVMMTYFGVNYYLSGLHSYAAGDPVPIPAFIYYLAAAFLLLGVLAKWKYRLHYQ